MLDQLVTLSAMVSHSTKVYSDLGKNECLYAEVFDLGTLTKLLLRLICCCSGLFLVLLKHLENELFC